MRSGSVTAEQYRVLVEQAPIMLWRAGLDAKRDYVNAAWLGFTGAQLDGALGDGWTASVHADDVQRCANLYARQFARREPFTLEYRLRRADGEYRGVFERGAPYRDAAGGYAGFVASCADVSDAHPLRPREEHILTAMTHELRTPLTPLLGYVHLVARHVARGEPIDAELVAHLSAQAARAAALVEHLADAARVECGAPLEIAPGVQDLGAIVRDVVGAREGRRIALELPRDPVAARVDAEHVRRAFAHLLDNALKFSPREREIEVAVCERDGEARIAVTDGGIGIPRADAARVPGPYARGSNSPATHYPGLGLGLFLAREVAAAHGGRLEIDSAAGRGTKAVLVFPTSSTVAEAS